VVDERLVAGGGRVVQGFTGEQVSYLRELISLGPIETGADKRLFRDTDNAMIAGVAAGLGKYLDIDVIIVRLIFVALTFFGGSGILIYVLLWLLVPAAKTNSERLQMRGLAVNVDNIKQAISEADVPGATRRASRVVGKALSLVVRVILAIVGVGLTIGGIAVMLASAVLGALGLVRGLQAGSVTLFPVGAEQVAVLVCGVVVLALAAAVIIASGLALVRRKWSIPGWAMAAIVGVFMVAASVGTAFGFDSAQSIQDRYLGLQHSQTHTLTQPITRLHIEGANAIYRIDRGDKAAVEIRTFGKVDTHAIKFNKDANGVLTINTRSFAPSWKCGLFCPFGPTQTEIIIHTPNPDMLPSDAPGGTNLFYRNSADYKEIYQQDSVHYLAPAMPVRPSIGN